RGVLAHDVDRAKVAPIHGLEHLAQVPALLVRELRVAPSRRELGMKLRDLEVLKPGQASGDRAHVASALHVVLAAQRVEPTAVTTDLSGEKAEVDQGEHVVGGVVMLRDAERPADHSSLGACVIEGNLLDRCRGYSGLRFGALEGVGLNAASELLITGRRPPDALRALKTR